MKIADYNRMLDHISAAGFSKSSMYSWRYAEAKLNLERVEDEMVKLKGLNSPAKMIEQIMMKSYYMQLMATTSMLAAQKKYYLEIINEDASIRFNI